MSDLLDPAREKVGAAFAAIQDLAWGGYEIADTIPAALRALADKARRIADDIDCRKGRA